ncbi:cupredoxin domain-containing protein [Methanoculleus sp. UBA303]|uniref:cupredoxin domain-containing protein n=1 Tax=Methanoculleus sp. UBA303 TaxID=1915497 RepID=UPI0025DBFED2|nr:hypothetical protein [Methanoculleus sp. UBA303]
MKNIFGILALMVIASIMIAGCVQPAGNQTVTPGTTTPGVTETPMATTTPVTTETPAATTTTMSTETPMATATTATPMGTGTTIATTTTSATNVTETPPAPPAAGGETVSITDSGFVPQTLNVSPGTTVTWTNDAATNETVSATGAAGFFNSGMLQPGDSYNYTFSTEDNYTYQSQESGFVGTIIVTSNTTA